MSWGHGANQGLGSVVGNLGGATDAVASQEVFWLNKALIQAQSVLYKTALSPKLANYLETAFGSGYDAEAANDILSQWRGKDFSQLPPVVILSPEAMNGARGAYSAENNTIYLSSALLVKGSVTAARYVLLEEFGHYLDAQVNAQDASGDEGEIWRNLVLNRRMSAAQLDALKTENDFGTVTVAGESVAVEMANITGTAGNDTLTGTAGDDNISGLDGSDTLNGLGGNDNLSGGNGNDILNGDTGDDYFTNDGGNDTINGGSGNDRYDANYSNASSGLTMTYDTATGSGTITVGTEIDTFTSIEDFEGFNGTEYDDVIFGGTAGDYFSGGLAGGSGNDTISGNAGDDRIYGEDGNDVLNGGANNDELYGGNGNDVLQGANGNSGERDYLKGDLGSDQFILGASNWIGYDDGLTNNAGTNDYAEIADFNTSENDVIQLQGGLSYLLNVVGADTQILIDKPSTEPDELIGIIKNRTGLSLTASYFVFNQTLPTITLALSPSSVTEDGTNNLVYTFTRSGSTTSSITVNYSITGTADATDYIGATPGTGKTITFNPGSATATLTIDPTADTTVEPDETVILTLATGTGYTIGTTAGVTGTITNDDITNPGFTLVGEDDDDYLVGGNGNDTLQGLGGNDVLNGGAGIDTLDGGTGNDLYFVDNSGDVVLETVAGTTGGTDTIYASVTYTLPTNIENLLLLNTGNLNDNINATGNTLNNKLTGNNGNNTLSGDAGNDILNGKGGLDTLVGGAGNDTYIVDTTTDTITELAGQGTDIVQSTVSFSLAALTNIENLTLAGTGNIDGMGNSSTNTLKGNNSNNILNGGAGRDTLTGGLGADTFIVQFGQSLVTAPDRITDFAVGVDKIDLLTQAGAATGAPTAFSRAADSNLATLTDVVNQVFTDADGLTAGAQALGVNGAALVSVTTAGIVGTYLIVNDNTAGFQSANDAVVNITGFSGTLPGLGAIPPSSFFI